MNRMQEQVREFHQVFGVDCPPAPTMPDEKTRELREKLISEELREFMEANSAGDLISAADAIADMAYVVFGAAIAYGIDLQPVFDEVHRSNMSKLWTLDETIAHSIKESSEHLTFVRVGDWKYIAKRADGKIIKSPSYKPADILNELEKQADAKERGE